MEVGCPLGLRKMNDRIQNGQMGVVPLDGFHPLMVYAFKLGVEFCFSLLCGCGCIVFSADILMGAILQNGLVGQFPLALRKYAVASVPLTVADLDLSILAALIGVVLVNVGLEVPVCVFFYGQVLPVLASELVYQNHIIFNKGGGHIFGDGTNTVNV